MTMAAIRRCISSPAARPGRSTVAAARQRGRCLDHGSVLQLGRLRAWHARSGLWHSGHERPGAVIRATRACRNSEPDFRRSAIHQRGRPPIATRGRHRSAATSRRSCPTTSSDSGIVSTTCTWTTGSRNGRTRAGDSISPAIHEDVRHRLADGELLQHLRVVPARSRRHGAQELSA